MPEGSDALLFRLLGLGIAMCASRPKLTLIAGSLEERLLTLLAGRHCSELDDLVETMARRALLRVVESGRDRPGVLSSNVGPTLAS